MRPGVDVPWRFGRHRDLPVCTRRKGGQRAVVRPLDLVTTRPGRRWLVSRVCVTWGRVFDDTPAPRDPCLEWIGETRGGASRVSRMRRVGVSLAFPGVASIQRHPLRI
jgi:hypothetical protein